MSDKNAEPKSILSQDQAKQLIQAQWETINMIVACNNTFVQEMQKSTTLSPADQRRLEQWTRAVTKAQRHVIETRERLNAKPAGVGLN